MTFSIHLPVLHGRSSISDCPCKYISRQNKTSPLYAPRLTLTVHVVIAVIIVTLIYASDILGDSLCYWFKHILFRRKGLGAAYNATVPSPFVIRSLTKKRLEVHLITHVLI